MKIESEKSGIKSMGSMLSKNRHLMLLIIIVFIAVVFQMLTSGLFLSSRNLGTLFLQFSVTGLVTIGAVVVMITRGIDLSVASVIGFVTAIGAVMNVKYNANPIVVLLVMFFIAMLIAACQGFFVSKFLVPAFVVTLAGQLTFKGISLLISNGQEIAPVDDIISSIATSWVSPTVSIVIISVITIIYIVNKKRNNERAKKLGIEYKEASQFVRSIIPIILFAAFMIYVTFYKGLPLLFIILFTFAAAMHIILNFTALGRQIYAVGANPEAAKFNGINPKKIFFAAFIFMGVSYFLASVGCMSRITGYSPSIGTGIEMDAIAAAVIGGTSLMGGYGTVLGALLGSVLLTSIDNGMILMNVSTYWQYAVKGLILLLAVIVDVKTNKS